MSSVWDIIKKGKETIAKQEKVKKDLDDEDFLRIEAPQKSVTSNQNVDKESVSTNSVEKPDWLSDIDLFNIRKIGNNPTLQLHEELLCLSRWLEPTSFDKCIRIEVLKDIKDALAEGMPEAVIHPFGSFITNLCLPDSDMDIMVECNEDRDYLGDMKDLLQKSGIAKKIEVISHARVPLVKFRHISTEIDVDMCFNQTSSILTCAYILRQLNRYPYLTPLVRIVKYMLSQRGLNDTYTGGIGSFMITLLCLASEQWLIRDGNDRGNLAHHLLQFLHFYGYVFNYDKLVLRVRNDGGFIDKRNKDWVIEGREHFLSVENPIDPSLDIGKSSYSIGKFKVFCVYTMNMLTWNMNQLITVNKADFDFLLHNVIRCDKRYPSNMVESSFYKQNHGVSSSFQNGEEVRKLYMDLIIVTAKKCNANDLKRVYEMDYGREIERRDDFQQKQFFSQKRSFSAVSQNNKNKRQYRRFCSVSLTNSSCNGRIVPS